LHANNHLRVCAIRERAVRNGPALSREIFDRIKPAEETCSICKERNLESVGTEGVAAKPRVGYPVRAVRPRSGKRSEMSAITTGVKN